MVERHVLGISGGKDSAALAVYMRDRHPELNIDYFFTDTGEELPEVHEFLGKLEGYLGKPIARLNPGRDFRFWLRQYNHFLPNPQTRWCTRMLKLKPFEEWVKPWLAAGDKVTSYVAIRADEDYREGYAAKANNLFVKLPFREAGIDKAGVIDILESSGVGYPKYYEWRSRSGCTFCFFQQKIEWVRLRDKHPDAYEAAKANNLFVKLPFREAGIDKAGVIDILENSGVGYPKYYEWRSRSGCTFCFFQQKIEWVRLRDKHPDADEAAKALEKDALEHGAPFTWSRGESLSDMEQPVRIAEITAEYEIRRVRLRKSIPINPLRPVKACPEDIDDVYGEDEGNGACAVCHK
jgi:3'-phosphoadenosine 5'-phosphosulfate sulfotransferase (PAPS reductase)/FAD synthetase